MITLTESAAKQITRLMETKGGNGKILRVFVDAGGCSGMEYGMSFDAPSEDAVHLESQGVTFFTDPVSAEYLKGSVVDFDDGLQGKGFEIKNPNATSTCGCGRSFQ